MTCQSRALCTEHKAQSVTETCFFQLCKKSAQQIFFTVKMQNTVFKIAYTYRLYQYNATKQKEQTIHFCAEQRKKRAFCPQKGK